MAVPSGNLSFAIAIKPDIAAIRKDQPIRQFACHDDSRSHSMYVAKHGLEANYENGSGVPAPPVAAFLTCRRANFQRRI